MSFLKAVTMIRTIGINAMSFLVTIVGVKQTFVVIFAILRYRSIFIQFL